MASRTVCRGLISFANRSILLASYPDASAFSVSQRYSSGNTQTRHATGQPGPNTQQAKADLQHHATEHLSEVVRVEQAIEAEEEAYEVPVAWEHIREVLKVEEAIHQHPVGKDDKTSVAIDEKLREEVKKSDSDQTG